MTEHTGQTDELGDEHDDIDTTHLNDVEDGCGCAEVWEHLSSQREADAN